MSPCFRGSPFAGRERAQKEIRNTKMKELGKWKNDTIVCRTCVDEGYS